MLGLSLNFQHYLIPKTSYHLRLFHSALGDQIWSPLAFSNAACIYGNTFYFSKLIYRFSKYSLDNSHLVEFHFFSSKQVQKDTLHLSFIQHEYYSLKDVVGELEELVKNIRFEVKKAKKLEPNRKGTFIILDLEQAQLKELANDSALQARFINVVKTSYDERIYVFACTPDAQALPGAVLKAFDWACFVGAKNTAFAKAFYGQEEEIFSEKREIIGTLYKGTATLLTPIHELMFVPSAFKLAQDRYAENEEEAFRRLLDSL